MDLIKQKFITTFTSYIIENKLNFGFAQEGYKIDKSAIYLTNVYGKVLHIGNVKNINIEQLLFESKIPVVLDFKDIKNYVKSVLDTDDELATYVLGLSKFGDRITLLKEFSNNENWFLKILGQPNIHQDESLKLKQLNMVLDKLETCSVDYESQLRSFIKVNKSVFKNPELLARLLSFLEDHPKLDKEYFTNLLKVKTEDLFLESDNQQFGLRIDKAQLYACIDFGKAISKDNYWKMLKNIEKFYKSTESKEKGIEYAIIDNYSNTYSYFRLTIETNENNILDKQEIESLTYELFANFAISNSKKATVSDKLTADQIKEYHKIFDMFILNKKIPHKVESSQKFKI